MICACNGVTRGAIDGAIVAGGLTTVTAVSRATRAATGCGSCAGDVERVLAAHEGSSIRNRAVMEAKRPWDTMRGMSADGIVIVGGGIAGLSLCEAVRERDDRVPITLICGEDRACPTTASASPSCWSPATPATRWSCARRSGSPTTASG